MRLFKLILLLMLIASIVPTVMVGWTSVVRTRELLVRDAQELAQERVKQLRLKAESVLSEPTRAVLGLSRVPGFFQLPLPEQQSHIASVLKQQAEVAVITVYGPDGQRLPGLQGFAVTDIPPSEVAEHEARSAAMLSSLTELRHSEVYWSAARGVPVLAVAYPLGDPPKGFVAAEVSLGGLVRVLEKERVGSSGFAYVVDSRGKLVAGPGLGAVAVGSELRERPVVAHLLATLASSPQAESLHVGNFGDGKARVVGAYSAVPGVGWAVVSEQPIELAYRQVSTMERQIAYGVGSAILVAIGLAALFSRTLSKPLKAFGKAALEIARGKFGVQVQLSSRNELGDLAKTFNYMSAQIEAYDHETKRLYESLEQGYLETIVALANSIDSKDAYTRGHSQRVGDVAVEIGREMGLSERELKLLQYGGILHDIGKIGIVESILLKQSRLTEEEMVTMRDHPLIGDTIIRPVSFLASVRAAVRSHHERWDGKGYPDGLKGEAIPLIARIVNCADTFDACTSTRPYQKAMPFERAMEILEGLRGAQLDPAVLDALRRMVEKKGIPLSVRRERVKLAS
ncbi:MAG: HD domain-containing protein [Myxococcales bacterium]|nr:HD domain-containing protein [Myxococcales bacterium]